MELIHWFVLLLMAVFGFIVFFTLVSANARQLRLNSILERCEGLRLDWLDAAPNDIWETKKFHKATTTKEDLFRSYEGLMEATGRAVRLSQEMKIFLPKSERKNLDLLIAKLNECAVDANAAANFTQLELDGVERVDALRQALNALRSRAIGDLEAILYADADRRAFWWPKHKS